jgi:hypothetical protein
MPSLTRSIRRAEVGAKLTNAALARGRTIMTRSELKELTDECTTLEELQALGAKLGYKEGWAVYVWEARGAQ